MPSTVFAYPFTWKPLASRVERISSMLMPRMADPLESPRLLGGTEHARFRDFLETQVLQNADSFRILLAERVDGFREIDGFRHRRITHIQCALTVIPILRVIGDARLCA